MSALLDGASIFVDMEGEQTTRSLSSSGERLGVNATRQVVILHNSSYGRIELGSAADIIAVDKVEENYLDAGDGDNIINLLSSSDVDIYGGNGNDIINAANTSEMSIYAGAGNDIINISGDTSNNINGEAGNDIIKIKGGAEYPEATRITAGKGNDIISITDLDHDYVLDNSDALATDRDILNLTKYYSSDFKFSYDDNGNLVMMNASLNVAITIEGWKNKALKKIIFADKVMTERQLENGCDVKTIVLDNESNIIYEGTNQGENIAVNGGYHNIIKAGTGNDVITVNGGIGHEICAGAGDDTIKVNNGEGIEIYTGAKDDDEEDVLGGVNVVNVNDAQQVLIVSGDNITEEELFDYDKGTLKDKEAIARVEAYWAGTLKGDTINVKNVDEIKYYGGVGNDTITLSGRDMMSSSIDIGDADDGNDIIEISNAANADIAGGNGDDKYIIHWNTIGHAVIRNSNDPWNEDDIWSDDPVAIKQEKDLLVLKGADYADVDIRVVRGNDNFEYNGQTSNEVVRIIDKNDARHYMDIAFWRQNGMDIMFDDVTISKADIDAKLGSKPVTGSDTIRINASGAYEVGYGVKWIKLEKKGLDVTLFDMPKKFVYGPIYDSSNVCMVDFRGLSIGALAFRYYSTNGDGICEILDLSGSKLEVVAKLTYVNCAAVADGNEFPIYFRGDNMHYGGMFINTVYDTVHYKNWSNVSLDKFGLSDGDLGSSRMMSGQVFASAVNIINADGYVNSLGVNNNAEVYATDKHLQKNIDTAVIDFEEMAVGGNVEMDFFTNDKEQLKLAGNA